MEGLYDIFRGSERIGKAEVTRHGLYYRFRCCCNLTGEVIYRIVVQCADATENLGIPLPCADAFVLDKRIPANRFSTETPMFFAVPRHPKRRDDWIPVKPDEPFSYLDQIRNARFVIRDGTAGVVIKASDPVQQGSDPIP